MSSSLKKQPSNPNREGKNKGGKKQPKSQKPSLSNDLDDNKYDNNHDIIQNVNYTKNNHQPQDDHKEDYKGTDSWHWENTDDVTSPNQRDLSVPSKLHTTPSIGSRSVSINEKNITTINSNPYDFDVDGQYNTTNAIKPEIQSVKGTDVLSTNVDQFLPVDFHLNTPKAPSKSYIEISPPNERSKLSISSRKSDVPPAHTFNDDSSCDDQTSQARYQKHHSAKSTNSPRKHEIYVHQGSTLMLPLSKPSHDQESGRVDGDHEKRGDPLEQGSNKVPNSDYKTRDDDALDTTIGIDGDNDNDNDLATRMATTTISDFGTHSIDVPLNAADFGEGHRNGDPHHQYKSLYHHQVNDTVSSVSDDEDIHPHDRHLHQYSLSEKSVYGSDDAAEEPLPPSSLPLRPSQEYLQQQDEKLLQDEQDTDQLHRSKQHQQEQQQQQHQQYNKRQNIGELYHGLPHHRGQYSEHRKDQRPRHIASSTPPTSAPTHSHDRISPPSKRQGVYGDTAGSGRQKHIPSPPQANPTTSARITIPTSSSSPTSTTSQHGSVFAASTMALPPTPISPSPQHDHHQQPSSTPTVVSDTTTPHTTGGRDSHQEHRNQPTSSTPLPKKHTIKASTPLESKATTHSFPHTRRQGSSSSTVSTNSLLPTSTQRRPVATQTHPSNTSANTNTARGGGGGGYDDFVPKSYMRPTIALTNRSKFPIDLTKGDGRTTAPSFLSSSSSPSSVLRLSSSSSHPHRSSAHHVSSYNTPSSTGRPNELGSNYDPHIPAHEKYKLPFQTDHLPGYMRDTQSWRNRKRTDAQSGHSSKSMHNKLQSPASSVSTTTSTSTTTSASAPQISKSVSSRTERTPASHRPHQATRQQHLNELSPSSGVPVRRRPQKTSSMAPTQTSQPQAHQSSQFFRHQQHIKSTPSVNPPYKHIQSHHATSSTKVGDNPHATPPTVDGLKQDGSKHIISTVPSSHDKDHQRHETDTMPSTNDESTSKPDPKLIPRGKLMKTFPLEDTMDHKYA